MSKKEQDYTCKVRWFSDKYLRFLLQEIPVQQPLKENYLVTVNFHLNYFHMQKFIILISFKVDYIGRRIFVSYDYYRFL